MKSKLVKLKSHFTKNGFSRNNLILTVVALIEIIAIMVVSTSAWVETISTVEISSVSGKIEPKRYTTAKFDGTEDELDLTAYFNESGNVHLASASSADGKNFFFPKINTSPVKYRKGTVNDINVNYISFSVIIDATESAGDLKFYFDSDPSILVGDAETYNSSIKLAISKGNETKIFSKAEAADPAVTEENDTAGSRVAPTTYTFAEYAGINATTPIFQVDYGTTTEVTFTLWLEDPDMSSNYTGSSVQINNLKLITDTEQYQVTFLDRTTSFYNGGTANGLYWVENDDAKMWVYDATSGKSIAMKQSSSDPTKWTAILTPEFITNKDSDLYFLRTASDASNPTPTSSYNTWKTKLAEDTNLGKTFTAYSNVVGSDVKYGTWSGVTEILLDTADTSSLPRPASGSDNTAADISLNVNNITYEMNYKTVGSSALWRCYIPSDQLPNNVITFSFTKDNTKYTYNAPNRGSSLKYVITSSNTGYWDPPAVVQVYAGTRTGAVDTGTALGTISVSGGKSGATEVLVTPGTEVTLNAADSEAYRFMGWYKNSNYTSAASLTDDNKFTPTESTTYTFYALYQRQYHVQLHAVTGTTVDSSTGGTVQFKTETATNKVDKYLLDDGIENADVTFTATAKANNGYEFLGWYSNSSGSGTAAYPSTQTTIDVGTVKQNYTLYAIFKLKEYSVSAVAKPAATDDTSKVKFNDPASDAGTTVTVTVQHGKQAIFQAVPAEDSGYEFVGWYSDEALSKSVSTANPYTMTNITSPQTLYAKFKLKDVKVTANAVTGTTSPDATGGTVKIDSGTAGSSVNSTKQYGSSFTLTATPTSSDYEFKGWFTAATGGSAITGLASGCTYTDTTITLSSVKADTQVFARFEKAGTTIYLKPNDGWKSDNARFAAYMWNGSEEQWYDLTGPDSNGCYSFTCANNWTNIIFARMNPNTTDNNWTNKWNQTGDLTFSASTPCYVVTDFSDGNTTGKWTTYPPENETTVTITFDSTNVDWVDDSGAAIYLYDRSSAAHYEMTLSENLKWTVSVPASVTYISFYRCNGSWGSGTNSDTVTTYWNKWEPDGRGTSTTYKTSGDGSGSWQ